MEDTIETSALDQRQELRDAGVVAIIGTYSGEGDDPKVVNRVAETLKESLGSEFVQRYLGESEPVRIFEKSGKLSYGSNEVTVILSENQSRIWGAESEVGVYGTVDIGSAGSLDVVVEKDFACVDRSDAENSDTFPNPHAGVSC